MAAAAAPALFVVLWSTGFIGNQIRAARGASLFTYLAIRMAIVVGLMALIATIARPRWPDPVRCYPQPCGRIARARLLSRRNRGRDRAFDSRRPLGADSGLQPILTSTFANCWLGERVTPLQWIGLGFLASPASC